MISSSCNIGDFIEAVRGKDKQDIIHFAIQEATEAERLQLRKHTTLNDKRMCGAAYAAELKDLIHYLRYAVKPNGKKFDPFNLD